MTENRIYLSCFHPAAETRQHRRFSLFQSHPWWPRYMTSCRRAAASSHCVDTAKAKYSWSSWLMLNRQIFRNERNLWIRWAGGLLNSKYYENVPLLHKCFTFNQGYYLASATSWKNIKATNTFQIKTSLFIY